MVPMGAAGEKRFAGNFIKLSHFHHFFEKLVKFVSIGIPILVINNIIFLRSKVSAKILTKYLKSKIKAHALPLGAAGEKFVKIVSFLEIFNEILPRLIGGGYYKV